MKKYDEDEYYNERYGRGCDVIQQRRRQGGYGEAKYKTNNVEQSRHKFRLSSSSFERQRQHCTRVCRRNEEDNDKTTPDTTIPTFDTRGGISYAEDDDDNDDDDDRHRKRNIDRYNEAKISFEI